MAEFPSMHFRTSRIILSNLIEPPHILDLKFEKLQYEKGMVTWNFLKLYLGNICHCWMSEVQLICYHKHIAQ